MEKEGLVLMPAIPAWPLSILYLMELNENQ
jgi:hypothetical protein